ncbi:hypothetical protein [Gracilimonas tropica]|uniref:hypothetical protein n=1 Tax=Gracilimonas tropica TaxID=454600 RepID=UPI000365037E|nr:hypothetical protein [Gracilimonas tropica]
MEYIDLHIWGNKKLSRSLKIRNKRITHFFYISAVIYMMVFTIVGFWPSYFGLLFTEFPIRHWSIHTHAVIFMSWLLLLLTQVSLVAKGNTKLHRKLGVAGGVFGILMLIFGLVVAFMMPLARIESGAWTLDRGASFLIHPLGDILIFVGFFIPALYYRNKPELHKRLILIASLMLIFPAIARIEMAQYLKYIVWLIPLMASLFLDGFLKKRIYLVNLLGISVLILSVVGRYYVSGTEWWVSIGRSLLNAFL